MIETRYPRSPILCNWGEGARRATGKRLPNVLVRDNQDRSVRLYDLLQNGPALIRVANGEAEEKESPTLPIGIRQVVIASGENADNSGLLRGFLGGSDGWILVRPDHHVALALPAESFPMDALKMHLGKEGSF
jgi:hypothetical protein